MKKLVTPKFRNNLEEIFPHMFKYSCCNQGTHERFLQYALFSPYKDQRTGAVLFDQETVARIMGKLETYKTGHFVSGAYLNHLVDMINIKGEDYSNPLPCIYTPLSERDHLNTLGKIATLYTDQLGRTFHPGVFKTAEELNEYEVIKKGRMVMDANPKRLIKVAQGMCRQVTFSFSKEVLDMVEEELTSSVSSKRNGKVYFVSGKSYSYYLNRKDTNVIENTVEDSVELLDNEVSKKIARYMNNLPVGLFEEIVNNNMSDALNEIEAIKDEDVRYQQLTILGSIADQPKVFYRPSKNGNTDRLFGYGANITNLKKEVRKALTKDWVECDAKNLHLAIVANLWSVESLENFLATGKSFWSYIIEQLKLAQDHSPTSSENDPEQVKKYIKEATYGLVYGMSRDNIINHLDTYFGEGKGNIFVNDKIIKDILSARKAAYSYYITVGSIEDAYGRSHKVSKDNVLSIVSRVCQSYEQKLILSIFETLNEADGDFNITLYQFDGLSIKFDCNKEYWMSRINEVFNQKAKEMRIYTSLSWSFLDKNDKVVEQKEQVVEVITTNEIPEGQYIPSGIEGNTLVFNLHNNATSFACGHC